MEMTQFQRDFVRMLDSMREENKGETTCVGIGDKECEECPLTTFCGDNDICFNAEKIIEVVTRWAKEHPIVTMAGKFKEVFGVKPVDTESEEKSLACPKDVGFGIGINCSAQSCMECTEKFWGAEYKPPKADEEGV